MRTREIKRNEWAEFFDSFNRQHEGWLATLEILGNDIGAQVAGRELPFAGVLIKCDEPHGDEISIIVGTKPDHHITHTIRRPIQVALDQTDEGADVALAIKASDDVIAVLRFRAAVLSEQVDGIVTQPTKKVITWSRAT